MYGACHTARFRCIYPQAQCKDHARSWEAHERDQQFGANESIDIGNSQRLRQEGNSRISKVSAMIPGLANIIEKLRISWYFESPETDLHIPDNACCMDYANSWLSKRVYSLSKSQSLHCSIYDDGFGDTLELYTGVARARLPFTGLHRPVASKCPIQWIPAVIYNSGWMDGFQVCHGTIETISILDPLDVEAAYSHIASPYNSVQWHVQSHG